MAKSKEETTGKSKEKTGANKGTMATLGLAFFTNNADTQALPTYLTSIGREFKVARTSLGFVNTVSALVQTAALPMWGYLSDRFSRKKTLTAGILIWATATLLISFSGSFEQLLYFRIIVGIGLAAIVPTAFSIIVDMYRPEVRGRMFGVFWLMGMLGIVITVPILGMLDAPSLTFGIESNLTQLLILQYVPGFLDWLKSLLLWDYILK
ncbi:MAG: MFS transporter, partial [Candidatus Freyarchaeota archaeon]|nr:MFS transporter [Candidatus Jordarchaeia archaeon]